MLGALSVRLERLYLLTDTVPDSLVELLAGWPRLRVVPLGSEAFRERAFDWLDAAAAAGTIDVVHDTFGLLGAWFQAVGPDPDRKVRLLTTQYTTNWGWFTRVRRQADLELNLTYAVQRTLTLWRDRRVCSMADRVVVLGPGHEGDLVEGHGVPAARIEWMPSEIDVERFKPSHAPRDGRPTLLYVGTVGRNKGMDLLFDALERMRHGWPRLRLLLFGPISWWERRWLPPALARFGLGQVAQLQSIAPRAHIADWYQRADLFVFPSRFEGSPRAVREALACGLRCVVSDIPGNRGIDPDGAFMRFVPLEGGGEAWGEAIAALLQESPAAAASRSAAGVAHIRAHHSPAAVAGRVADLYARLLAEPPWSAPRADGICAGTLRAGGGSARSDTSSAGPPGS